MSDFRDFARSVRARLRVESNPVGILSKAVSLKTPWKLIKTLKGFCASKQGSLGLGGVPFKKNVP
jgi:hypothetical protein